MGEEMIPTISTGPVMEKTQPCAPPQASTSFYAKAALFESAPWLNDALSQVHDLEASGREYRGVGDLHVPASSSAATRILLSQIELPVLPKPSVSAASGGIIVIRFNTIEREAEFTVFPSGTVVLNLLLRGALAKDSELSPDDHRDVNNALLWTMGQLS